MKSRADAELFSQVHALLAEQQPARDRRTRDRHAYQCRQLLAPYDGWRLPGQHAFRAVQCGDLSPGGFSFFAQQPPEQPFVVICLGAVPFKFFKAAVRHVAPREQGDYFVGCEFVERIGN